MSENSPIPVRLSTELISRIDRISRRMGSSRGGVIKMCILAFLSRFEKDGLEMLPPDWEQILNDLDGRTHRYAAQNSLNETTDKPVQAQGQRQSVTYKKPRKKKK